MATILSSDGESSDVEVVYEEVSRQSKLRQELHMLEILRDSQEPIPANYSDFKARVSSLKYTFCQEVIDDVWTKLKDMMILERAGKLGNNFNKNSMCGRDNCVCNRELPVVQLISSESDSECDKANNDSMGSINRVQKTSIHKTSVSNKHVSKNHSHHYQSTTDSLNHNQKYFDKPDNCSSEVYNKSYTQNVTLSEEEIKTCKKKTKRTEKKVVNVSESDSHTDVHSEHTKSKSKINSESNKTVKYSNQKRTYCKNSSNCSRVVKETRTSGGITCPVTECIPSKETINDTEVNRESGVLHSVEKNKKQSHSINTESTCNENSVYKMDREEIEWKKSKKEKHITDKIMQSTDKFECVSGNNCEDTSDTFLTQEKRKKRKTENKSEHFSTSNKSEKRKYQRNDKTTKNDKIPDVNFHNNHNNVSYNKESDTDASKYNIKQNTKVKADSWNEKLSGLTKCVYNLIENDMKKEKDNCDKTSTKTANKHKNHQSHSCGSTEDNINDREQSVVIDAHIQIVRSSKSEGKRSNNCDDNVSSPTDDGTSSRKKHKCCDDMKKTRRSGFNKAELKKFIETEKKERRKEKAKIINHEWQLIHDRLVELMAPKLLKGGNFSANS